MKTHIVIDTILHEEYYVGTLEACQNFLNEQTLFSYILRPLTEEELKDHNP